MTFTDTKHTLDTEVDRSEAESDQQWESSEHFLGGQVPSCPQVGGENQEHDNRDGGHEKAEVASSNYRPLKDCRWFFPTDREIVRDWPCSWL